MILWNRPLNEKLQVEEVKQSTFFIQFLAFSWHLIFNQYIFVKWVNLIISSMQTFFSMTQNS